MSHRAVTVVATWRRFAPLQKRAGITRIADVTGLDTLGIPVFAAIRPMGRSLSTQQGKGVTPEHARVSALMESLETWTAEHLALPVVRATAKTLGDRAVDVRKLPRPRGRLDRDARWRWVEGRDVLTDRAVLVPEQAVTLDTTFTTPPVFDISSKALRPATTFAKRSPTVYSRSSSATAKPRGVAPAAIDDSFSTRSTIRSAETSSSVSPPRGHGSSSGI